MTNLRRAILLTLTLLLVTHGALSAQDSAWEDFVHKIGWTVYKAAWPTATYEGAEFKEVRANGRATDVVFVAYGKSAFDDSSLWTEVIVTVEDGKVTHLGWGKNNAILAQPGETLAALGKLISDLNSQNNPPRRFESAGNTLSWKLTDRCSDDRGIRVRFYDVNNQIVWPNVDEDYVIPAGESRTFQLTVGSNAKICFGAQPDQGGSTTYWGVALNGKEGCKDCCHSVSDSPVQLDLSCR